MQEYKVIQFNTSDFQDNFGNTWCNVAFEGISEPIKWVVKDPSKVTVGQMVYGEITDETSKAGKPYQRFRSKPRPEATENAPQGQSDEYWANKQNQIKAQWAINQSREYIQHMLGDGAKLSEVLDTAKIFYSMVDIIVSPEEIDPNDVDIVNLKDVPL